MNGPEGLSSGSAETQSGTGEPGPREAGKMRRLIGRVVVAVFLVFLVLGYLGAPGVKGVFRAFFGAPSMQEGGRVPLYYQSPMHPWVKSHKPGKCTVCGMDLVPVYALPNPDGGEGHGDASQATPGRGGGGREVGKVGKVGERNSGLLLGKRGAHPCSGWGASVWPGSAWNPWRAGRFCAPSGCRAWWRTTIPGIGF